MRERALAYVCGAFLGGCSAADHTGILVSSGDPARPKPLPEAGADRNEPPASAADAAVDLPTWPKVRLAPSLEAKLTCDNVELPFDFDARGREFNVDHAFWMMWFSERAFFATATETRTELEGVGFHRYRALIDNDTGLELYVAGSDTSVIVSIRGSNATNDTIADLNFPLDDGAQHGVAGRVHRGFASALTPSFDELAKTVRAFASQGQTVWMTGHSLGGAEATLAAARLAREKVELAPLYTYGAPRAGNADFANDAAAQLRGGVYRIVNEMDIVPRLPPAKVAADEAARALPLGQAIGAQVVRDLDYRHVGQMMWLEYSDGTDLTVMPVMSDDDDQAYWADTAKGGTIGTLLSSQQQGARHAQQRYLCRLLALRSARRAETDGANERAKRAARMRLPAAALL